MRNFTSPSITETKPNAKYYIDDRAIRFENWENTMNLIKLL